MLSCGLAVQQFEASLAKPFYQVNQGDLAGVGFAVKHALAEEGGTEGDAIEAANQVRPLPRFNAVGEAQLVQARVSGD